VQTPSLFWEACVRFDIPIYTTDWIIKLLSNAIFHPMTCYHNSATGKMYEHCLFTPFEGLLISGGFLSADQKQEIKKLSSRTAVLF
jgi:hypothetical protein